MTQKCDKDEKLKTRAVIQRVKNKYVREAVKIVNQTTINTRKAESLAKKIEKNLIKAQKLMRLKILIDLQM